MTKLRIAILLCIGAFCVYAVAQPPPPAATTLQARVAAILQSLKTPDSCDGPFDDTCWELCEIGEPAVDPLLHALKDKSWHLRYKAVFTLGRMHPPRALAPVLTMLNDPDSRVSEVAIDAVWRFHDRKAVPALFAVLKREKCCLSVIMALTRLGDARAVLPMLLHYETCKQYDAYLRLTASCLSQFGTSGYATLARCTIHPSPNVRRLAALGLGQFGDPHAVPLLIPLLSDGNDDVSNAAIEALSGIGAPAIPALLGVAQRKKVLYRCRAAEVLGRISDPRARAALLKLRKDPSDRVRGTVAWVLDWNGSPDAAVDIIPLLNDPVIFVRRCAADWLWSLPHDARLVEPLLRAMRDADPDIRVRAMSALCRYDDPRTIKLLIRTIGETNLGLRSSAMTDLSIYDEPPSIEPLIRPFRVPATEETYEVARALGRFHDPRALVAFLDVYNSPNAHEDLVEALTHACDPSFFNLYLIYLRDENQNIRTFAARALGKLGDPRAAAPLAKAFGHKDGDPQTLDEAIFNALKILKHPSAVPALCAILTDFQSRNNNDLTAVQYAVKLLGMIGDQRACKTLGMILENTKDYTNDYEVTEAANSLVQIGGEPAIRTLAAALHAGKSQQACDAAAQGLARLKGESAITALREATATDAGVQTRVAALPMLGRLHPPGSFALLTAALDDPSMQVQHAAIEGLGVCGDPLAVPVLLKRYRKHDPDEGYILFPALAHTRDPRVADTLLQDALAHDNLPWDIISAGTALDAFKDPGTLSVLRHTLHAINPYRRIAAMQALAVMDAAGINDVIIAALADEEESVQEAALTLVATRKIIRAIPTLRRMKRFMVRPQQVEEVLEGLLATAKRPAAH